MSNDLPLDFGFLSPGIVSDISGKPIDTRGPRWKLNNPVRNVILIWERIFRTITDRDTFEHTVRYFVRLVQATSADNVRNAFAAIQHLSKSKSFVESDKNGKIIPFSFFAEMRVYFGSSGWRLHYIRDWYRSCCDHGCAAMCVDVLFEIEAQRVGVNVKGHAVLSLHPDEGPLNDLEIFALINALSRECNLDLSESVAIWLCIAFGCNSLQLALLREDDFQIDIGDPNGPTIRIPRMKKRSTEYRKEFRVRRLVPEIASIVEMLIQRNRTELRNQNSHASSLPLFIRRSPKNIGEMGQMSGYEWHLNAQEIQLLVSGAVRKLNVISPRTGSPLIVTPRRLRYTFATRLVREGASKIELADALDHSDTQCVHIYFDVKSDIVDSLDRAMAIKLGPVGQSFLGKMVRDERSLSGYERGEGRIVFHDKESDSIDSLGSCGSYSFCSKFAPLACYTCRSFRPWVSAPHDKILDDLLERRRIKLQSGQDGRIVRMYDSTILAIGHIVSEIHHLNSIE